MDLAALVASFATGTYTVTRRASGGFSRGIAQDTTDTTFTITGSLSPASGRDLLRLPELRRSNETRVLFTTTQLQVGDPGELYEADWVSIDGAQWEVQHVESWGQPGGGQAYRCILQAPQVSE